MKSLQTCFVRPSLPAQLSVLADLAYNTRWTWNVPMRDLFRRIDQDLWEISGHNPVAMLGELDPTLLKQLERDESFMYQLEKVQADHDEYMKGEKSWYALHHPGGEGPLTGYFSAEFGIADCVPIFSGGLGVLAGDHLKSASDMGVPIAGVGLLYQHGYFGQYLNLEGWQQERYPVNDFYIMPVSRVEGADGQHLSVDIPFPGRVVHGYVWRVQVGRNPLYLLDTNHPDNSLSDRKITSELYGGDQEKRIQQEIVLGMGGVRMLAALGLDPPVLHSNEGHAAFLVLERIRQFMETRGLGFDAAREASMAGVIFTTHTPVPAGIDVFPRSLVEKYFSGYASDVGISMDRLVSMGRAPSSDGFNMAALAVRNAYGTNAVSKLHRETSRKMWQSWWPGIPTREIPIGAVTNGIHILSWISGEIGQLFDRYLGPAWHHGSRDRQIWERVANIPPAELWHAHERRRDRLVAFARMRARDQLVSRAAHGQALEAAAEVLDPEALTIGFARRFAPYKRAALLFKDVERLARLLTDRERPVQILLAGKAHPRDDMGKKLIRDIVAASRRPDLVRNIVFLEDYNLNIARYLVQGVDIWLNTPRRPKEASGTSGMKAVANGALHLSTSDGWWAEVDGEGLGWTIGSGEEYEENQYEYQDDVEARALYDLLEHEVVPLFYQRGKDGIPRGWVEMMKRSLSQLCPVFNSNRMVRQYTDRYYLPAQRQFSSIAGKDLSSAQRLADWKKTVRENWDGVSLVRFETDIPKETTVGTTGEVRAWLQLAPLLPQDICIEVVYGRIGVDFEIQEIGAVPLKFESAAEDNTSLFKGAVPFIRGGKFGVAIRILPRHRDLPNRYQMGLVKIVDSSS